MATIATGTVAKVQRDLAEATDALDAYWGRYHDQHGLPDAVADVHRAVEALTRAVSSLALIVEEARS